MRNKTLLSFGAGALFGITVGGFVFINSIIRSFTDNNNMTKDEVFLLMKGEHPQFGNDIGGPIGNDIGGPTGDFSQAMDEALENISEDLNQNNFDMDDLFGK